MTRRLASLCALLVAAGCFAPRFDLDPPEASGGSAAQGGAGTTQAGKPNGGSDPSSGAGATSGSSSAGTDAVGGSATNTGEAGNGGEAPSACHAPAEACSATQKWCDGKCVEQSDPKYGCGPTRCSASACPADVEATLKCRSNECVIDQCSFPFKLCDQHCVRIDDPMYGCEPTSCDTGQCPTPKPTTYCSVGHCVTANECASDRKDCSGFCVPKDAANGCDDVTSCARCAINEVCSGSPSRCTCIPDDVAACAGVACGTVKNNCGKDVQCPDTCAAPLHCGTVPATANTCVCD